MTYCIGIMLDAGLVLASASGTYAYDPGASVANEDPQPDAGDKQATEEAIDEGKAND